MPSINEEIYSRFHYPENFQGDQCNNISIEARWGSNTKRGLLLELQNFLARRKDRIPQIWIGRVGQ